MIHFGSGGKVRSVIVGFFPGRLGPPEFAHISVKSLFGLDGLAVWNVMQKTVLALGSLMSVTINLPRPCNTPP